MTAPRRPCAVADHNWPDWPDLVRKVAGGGAGQVLAVAGRAARAARDGATIAAPVHQAVYPDAERIRWRPYNGQPRGRDLIRMAPDR